MRTGVLYWFSRLRRPGVPAQTVTWQKMEQERMLAWLATGEAEANVN